MPFDEFSFFLGGYSAFGVAYFSGSLYEMIPDFGVGDSVPISAGVTPTPPDNNNVNVPACPGPPGPEPETRVKNYGLTLTRRGFIVLRTAERLLIGGGLYDLVKDVLKYILGDAPVIANAFISGGMVGVIQVGVNNDWKKLLRFGGGAAVFCGGMETLITALQSGGLLFLEGRPTFVFFSDPFQPDSLVASVMFQGSIAFGLWSMDSGDFPGPGAAEDEEDESFLDFLIRSFGRFSWGWILAENVHGLIKQVGIKHRLVTTVAVGGAMGTYWSTYGKRVRRTGWICMGGITLSNIVAKSVTGSELVSGLILIAGCALTFQALENWDK